MSTIKDNAKLLALKNEIASAIEADKLEAKMDILRLMAADLDLNEKDLEDVINNIKSANQEKENLTKLVASKKKWIKYSSIALVAIEWILAFAIAGKLSFGGFLLLAIINTLSVLIGVFVISAIIKQQDPNKRKLIAGIAIAIVIIGIIGGIIAATSNHSTPVEEEQIEQPAEQPTEQPAEQSAEQPAEQPTEQPTEQSAEQPAEQQEL